jgi:putative FmdB family regulatory protein
MSIYDYICEDCNTNFCISISLKDLIGATFSCPNCRGYNVKRKYHSIPVIYKAEGFTKQVKEGK